MEINLKRDKDDERELYKNRIIYSLPVHAGEWLNALATREQQEFLHADRRNHCDLIIQKTRKMFRNLSKPLRLEPEATYVNYRQYCQIKAYGVPKVSQPCGEQTVQHLYLSGAITEREIDSTQHFIHGCQLTAAPTGTPSVRNIFMIIACDNAEKQGPVAYGDDIFIQISESAGLPLYVQCENSTIDTFGGHLSLRLSQSPDIYCRFKILHWKPQLRYETSGTSVLFNSYAIIQHTASGHNLAAEINRWMPTFFGSECCVSCHTYRDTHKMETIENLWKIVGEVPK